mmetsp:Transcript_404/g.740  ORF Transcript_404/g.740 Transcript_404/m.740 type:complete len:259 (-) Transcript_404:1488-2264(-)
MLSSIRTELFLIMSLFHVDAFECALGFALREVLKVVVVWRKLNEPFPLDVSHHADVVFGSKNEFIVHAPLGLMLQHSRRMQCNDLIILDSEIMTRPLEMSNLHKEARKQALANVGVILFRVEVIGLELKAITIHDAHQLCANRVSALQCPCIKKIVVAPRCRLLIVLPRMIHVKQRQMIAVHMLEPPLGLVSRALRLSRPHERIWGIEHGNDREDLVRACQLRGVQQHLRELWIQRELGHHRSEFCQFAVVVERAKIV